MIPENKTEKTILVYGATVNLIEYCDSVAKILKDNGFHGKAEALEERYMRLHDLMNLNLQK